MSIVLGGYGLGCIVTRGYGCLVQPSFVAPDITIDVDSPIRLRLDLLSLVSTVLTVLSRITTEQEGQSAMTTRVDVTGTIPLVINLRSPAVAVQLVDLQSLISVVVSLESRIA